MSRDASRRSVQQKSTRGTNATSTRPITTSKASLPDTYTLKKRRRRGSTSFSCPVLPYGDSITCTVVSQQKTVFEWYESNRMKDDAAEIFSSEWQQRIREWHAEHRRDFGALDAQQLIVKYETEPAKLRLGTFFIAHPIQGFALWHVLQACDELGRTVCSTFQEQHRQVADWQEVPPIQYLCSKSTMQTWRASVGSFANEMQNNPDPFKQAVLEDRLLAIVNAVQNFDESLWSLEKTFDAQKVEMARSLWVLKAVRWAVHERCHLIQESLSA